MGNYKWRGLAADIGASGGKTFVGEFDGKRLVQREIHRFENHPVKVLDTLHWDILRLYQHVLDSIQIAKHFISLDGQEIATMGIDSWAVDYGLIDASGGLLGNPVHYRDLRTNGVMEQITKELSAASVFAATGIQFLSFNTIYQLVAMERNHNPQLQQAQKLLLIPDLLRYFLTGVISTEYTNATTTQLVDPRTRDWNWSLLETLGLPQHIFTSIHQPGSQVVALRPDINRELGVSHLRCVSVATHDTASAVTAIPTLHARFAYVVCGTWSLFGTEVKFPVMNEKALQLNFTNEGGTSGFRLLKNIMGLWLLQELQNEWEREDRPLSWEQTIQLAKEATPFQSLIDPDDPRFLAPGNMSSRIGEFCRESGQLVPSSQGEFVRCVLESLTLKYRWTLDQLHDLLGYSIQALHLVGGGIRNELLCQWTANACQLEVLAGPIEASATGNLLMQLVATGELSDVFQARELVRQSIELKRYEPTSSTAWHEAYLRFRSLVKESLNVL